VSDLQRISRWLVVIIRTDSLRPLFAGVGADSDQAPVSADTTRLEQLSHLFS
jgi:hypothetical protein